MNYDVTAEIPKGIVQTKMNKFEIIYQKIHIKNASEMR